MSGSSIGHLFRVTIFGESHGPLVGMTIDGCPAGIKLDLKEIQKELARRRPGQSKITTHRQENDHFQLVSGIYLEKTTGAPITGLITNGDARSADYRHLENNFRPSHADFTYQKKYGLRDHRGGGRSSARETAARVLAGAIAKQILKKININISAYVSQVGEIKLLEHKKYSLKEIDKNIVRCPDEKTADKMIKLIESVKKEGDTIGGMISCQITGMPAGLGEPVFDKLHADLAKAMMSINAVKGFEYGSGFSAATMRGSQHNDLFIKGKNKVKTKTNFSGGIQGGISNGMDIYFNVAFKPVATLMKKQKSLNQFDEKITIEGKGRHDPCVVPRAVPIVEAMAAIIIVDHYLRNLSAQWSDDGNK